MDWSKASAPGWTSITNSRRIQISWGAIFTISSTMMSAKILIARIFYPREVIYTKNTVNRTALMTTTGLTWHWNTNLIRQTHWNLFLRSLTTRPSCPNTPLPKTERMTVSSKTKVSALLQATEAASTSIQVSCCDTDSTRKTGHFPGTLHSKHNKAIGMEPWTPSTDTTYQSRKKTQFSKPIHKTLIT